MVLRKNVRTAILLAAAALSAAPASSETLRERMDGAYERVLSKNGIEIGGGIDAEYFNSSLGGKALVDSNYSYETTQFTSFDLDMRYRPYDFIGARALVRFHQDWQTFFATRSRVLAARWLSVDGNLGNMLGFNFGDFRQKYTPLTLWSPELEFVYEPTLFAEARGRLMDEQFLRGNERPLQGVNLNFAKRFNLPVTEFRADAIGSRVRKAEFLDRNGGQLVAVSQDANWDGFDDGSHASLADMDRFFVAANSEAIFLNNVAAGGTFLSLMDDRGSFQHINYGRTLLDPNQGLGPNARDSLGLNGEDSVLARDVRVIGGHGGVDIAGFLGNKGLTLEILGEFAQSSETHRYAWHFRREPSGIFVTTDPSLPARDGKALNAQLGAGFQPASKAWGVNLVADYIDNEASFLNPLAQSPTFVGARIMNTENDLDTRRLYSVFDALNNGMYKFTPSTETARYQHAPFSKSSYHNGVSTVEQLEGFRGDPNVQMLLPLGNATPNRSGVNARLTAHWADALHATVLFASMKEKQGGFIDSTPVAAATYGQIGGGVKAEIGKLAGWTSPLDLSASYVMSERKRDRTSADLADPKAASGLLMAGFTWRPFGKWGLLAGFEQATLDWVTRSRERISATNAAPAFYQYDDKGTHRQFRAGLEYSLGKNAYFLLSGGLLQAERTRTSLGSVQTGEGPDAARSTSDDFSQTQSQALIKVRF